MLQANMRALVWRAEANPGQTPPAGEWRVWYAQGGRGSGKTRTGSEAFAELVLTHPAGDWAAIGPTFGDSRDTMVEHRRSGLLMTLGSAVVKWNRSIGEIKLANGAWIFCDGADDGAERIQGKELRGAWCDEIGLWKKLSAWTESLMFAVRDSPALILATGTPKGNKGVVKLLRAEPEGRVVFTHPSLADNRANLEPRIVEEWERLYEGTRLERQELRGEVLEDVEGALWRWSMIEDNRAEIGLSEARNIIDNRCVIAVDPAITAHDDSDETGIVAVQSAPVGSDFVIAQDRNNAEHFLVLDDRSGIYTPDEWAAYAIGAYHDLRADRIVAEANQGGEMVKTVIHSIDPDVPVTLVWASKGKQPRAEPVAGLYEQGRVHHVAAFAELETEQTTWVPGEKSPNHLDALVWGVTDLLEPGAQHRSFGNKARQRSQSITADLLTRPM